MAQLIAVTMADVGKSVGLSQATVSLALRNHKSIPPPTRELVQQAAQRLGYRQHAGISSLMARIRSHKRTPYRAKIAAITKWEGGFTRELSRTPYLQWKGAQRRALELGYELEEFELGKAGLSERRIASILKARSIEGVIVFPFRESASVKLPWDHLASVTLEYTLTDPLLHRVVTSHYDSMLLAIEQIRRRGYKRIGFIQDEFIVGRVHQTWLAAFQVFGGGPGALKSNAIVTVDDQNASIRLSRWLRSYKPDAVIYGGIGLIRRTLNQIAYPAPERIGLVSLSDYRPEENCARIDEGWERAGAAAVDSIVGQLHRGERGVPKHPLSHLVKGDWIEGTSLKPASGA